MLHSCPQQSGSTSPAQLSLNILKEKGLQSWPSPWSAKGGWEPTAGRMQTGHPQTVVLGLLRGMGKAGLFLTEGATGMRTPVAMAQLFWAGGTTSHSQQGAGVRGESRQCHDGITHQHSALPLSLFSKVKLSLVKPILQRLSPGTEPLPASSGHCTQLPPAGCPAAAPRCPAPVGTVSPAGPGR